MMNPSGIASVFKMFQPRFIAAMLEGRGLLPSGFGLSLRLNTLLQFGAFVWTTAVFFSNPSELGRPVSLLLASWAISFILFVILLYTASRHLQGIALSMSDTPDADDNEPPQANS